MPAPTHLYKIIPSAPPEPLPDDAPLPLSALDAGDGFIHLSSAAQVAATADRFFADAAELWLLKITYPEVEPQIKWEEAGSGCFPHLYGRGLGSKEISDCRRFARAPGQKWADVMSDAWLQD